MKVLCQLEGDLI